MSNTLAGEENVCPKGNLAANFGQFLAESSKFGV